MASSVLVDKDALYRLIFALMAGHADNYENVGARVVLSKLTKLDGEELNALWEDIKLYVTSQR